MDNSRPGEPKDPMDEYGQQDDSIPHVSDEQAWGTSLNPVRETPMPAKNLNSVGGK